MLVLPQKIYDGLRLPFTLVLLSSGCVHLPDVQQFPDYTSQPPQDLCPSRSRTTYAVTLVDLKTQNTLTALAILVRIRAHEWRLSLVNEFGMVLFEAGQEYGEAIESKSGQPLLPARLITDGVLVDLDYILHLSNRFPTRVPVESHKLMRLDAQRHVQATYELSCCGKSATMKADDAVTIRNFMFNYQLTLTVVSSSPLERAKS